jgi:hypothetical protein
MSPQALVQFLLGDDVIDVWSQRMGIKTHTICNLLSHFALHTGFIILHTHNDLKCIMRDQVSRVAFFLRTPGHVQLVSIGYPSAAGINELTMDAEEALHFLKRLKSIAGTTDVTACYNTLSAKRLIKAPPAAPFDSSQYTDDKKNWFLEHIHNTEEPGLCIPYFDLLGRSDNQQVAIDTLEMMSPDQIQSLESSVRECRGLTRTTVAQVLFVLQVVRGRHSRYRSTRFSKNPS